MRYKYIIYYVYNTRRVVVVAESSVSLNFFIFIYFFNWNPVYAAATQRTNKCARNE